MLTLIEIIQDLHALESRIRAYERKYGITSYDFYQLYQQGLLDDEGFESLQSRFHGIPLKWAGYHAQCSREHELFKDKKGPYQQGPIMGLGQRKNTGANGVYWTSPRVPKRGRLNTDSDI